MFLWPNQIPANTLWTFHPLFYHKVDTHSFFNIVMLFLFKVSSTPSEMHYRKYNKANWSKQLTGVCHYNEYSRECNVKKKMFYIWGLRDLVMFFTENVWYQVFLNISFKRIIILYYIILYKHFYYYWIFLR